MIRTLRSTSAGGAQHESRSDERAEGPVIPPSPPIINQSNNIEEKISLDTPTPYLPSGSINQLVICRYRSNQLEYGKRLVRFLVGKLNRLC